MENVDLPINETFYNPDVQDGEDKSVIVNEDKLDCLEVGGVVDGSINKGISPSISPVYSAAGH